MAAHGAGDSAMSDTMAAGTTAATGIAMTGVTGMMVDGGAAATEMDGVATATAATGHVTTAVPVAAHTSADARITTKVGLDSGVAA